MALGVQILRQRVPAVPPGGGAGHPQAAGQWLRGGTRPAPAGAGRSEKNFEVVEYHYKKYIGVNNNSKMLS